MIDDSVNWTEAVGLLVGSGIDCRPEELSNPDWCARKLASMGYSLQITTETKESYLAKVIAIGKLSLDNPIVLETVANLEKEGCFFTYQLFGLPLYPTRGAHNTFFCVTMSQAAALALFNTVRAGANNDNADGSADTEHS